MARFLLYSFEFLVTRTFLEENLQANKSFQHFPWESRTEAPRGIFQAILIAGCYPAPVTQKEICCGITYAMGCD